MHASPDVSDFDPEALLATQTDEAFKATYDPIPEGDDYVGSIADEDPVFKQWPARDPGKPPLTRMEVSWIIDNPELAAKLGRSQLRVRQSIVVRLTGTTLSKDNNQPLAQIREAVGQASGQWNPRMLRGAGPAKLSVRHRTGDDGRIYEEVRKVVKHTG